MDLAHLLRQVEADQERWLPEPEPVSSGGRLPMKPRWERSYVKGRAWARAELAKSPVDEMEPADRTKLYEAVLRIGSRAALEFRLKRGGFGDLIEPARVSAARRLGDTASRKADHREHEDTRAFWHGVQNYVSLVIVAAYNDEGGDYLERFRDEQLAAVLVAWEQEHG